MGPTIRPEAAPVEIPYHRLRSALMLFGKPPSDLAPDEVQRVRRQAEREYRIEQGILESAEAVGVMVGEAELERALADIRAKYPDEQAFQASLEASELDAEQLRLALARQCKVNTILDRVVSRSPVVVDPVDIEIYYHAHFDKFRHPERRDAFHILISINPDFPENTRERALERMQTIAERLARKPHLFEELAGRHSECPTAMRGGRIGLVRRGQLFPSLDSALFRLGAGQLSAVVESEMGFHLLWCRRIEPPHTLALNKATATIRRILAERIRETRRRRWIAELLPTLNEGTPT